MSHTHGFKTSESPKSEAQSVMNDRAEERSNPFRDLFAFAFGKLVPGPARSFVLQNGHSWPWFLFLFALFLFLPSLPVQAQVQSQGWKELRRLLYPLSIKVPTRLSFRVERNKQGRPLLLGQLQNDRKGGVKKQSLQLFLPKQSKPQTVVTDDKGRFRLEAVNWPKRGQFRMQFAGTRLHAPSERQRMLDLRRVDLKIVSVFPSALSAGTKGFEIRVRLEYRGHPQKGMPVTLLLQAQKAQSSGLVNQLPKKIRKGLSRQAMVALMTLYTNEQGEARFVWEGKPLQGPAEIPLAVSFPGSTYFLPQRVRSLLVVTKVQSAESFADIWPIVGWIVLVLGVLGLLVWGYHKRWWERDDEPPILQSFDDLLGDIETGRVERVTSHEGFTQVVDEHTIAGVLYALGTKKPLVGVTVLVQPLDEEGHVTRWRWQSVSNGKGHFFVECPRHGKMQVTFHHPHYQMKQIEVTLPHQDRHRVLRVHLASYRHLIYETFLVTVRRMATGQTFDPRTQTAREFLRTLGTGQVEQLSPLAKAFEKAYYGSIIPTVEDYDILRDTFQQD